MTSNYFHIFILTMTKVALVLAGIRKYPFIIGVLPSNQIKMLVYNTN